MGQLIDITARLKQKANESENVKKTSSLKNQKAAKAPVFDLEEPRLKKKEEERREVKRTILSEFISAFVVLPEKGLKKVAIYDISDSGVSFDVPMEDGAFAKGEEIALRIYLNQMTYYPFIVRVAHVSSNTLEGLTRHGSVFKKNSVNNDALHHFVKFIEAISSGLKHDAGDLIVSNGIR